MLFDRVGAARRRSRGHGTRPGLIGLPEGEGSALSLTARGVWLVQIPLAHKTEAAGPPAPPPCSGHSILKTEFTGLGPNR